MDDSAWCMRTPKRAWRTTLAGTADDFGGDLVEDSGGDSKNQLGRTTLAGTADEFGGDGGRLWRGLGSGGDGGRPWRGRRATRAGTTTLTLRRAGGSGGELADDSGGGDLVDVAALADDPGGDGADDL